MIKPLAVTINGVTSNFTFDTTGRTFNAMGWVTQTITFVATGTSSTVNFVSDVSASGGTLNAGAALDNVVVAPLAVVLSPAVNVPLDWAQWGAILAIFFAGFMLIRRRRR